MTSPAILRRASLSGYRATTTRSLTGSVTRPRHITVIAVLMMATVGVRVHESVPFLAPLRPVAAIGLGAFLVLLAESSRASLREAFCDRSLRLVAAYFGWAILTAPFALWPGLAVSQAAGGIPVLLMCLALTLCQPDRATLERCLIGLTGAIIVLGVLSVIQGNAGGGRLSTIGGFDPNDLAAVSAVGFPLSLGVIARGRKFARLLGLAGAVVCPLVVVLTGSRGGSLALAAGSVVFALGAKGKRKYVLLGLLAVGGAVAWMTAPPTFRERINSLSSLDEDYNLTAYTGRKQVWKRGIGYVEDHPIAGVGMQNFPVAEGGYAAQIGIHAKWSATHNAYLQAFSELGIVGGVLFLTIFGVGLRNSMRLWRVESESTRHSLHRPELLASLISFGVSAYFLSHAYSGLFFGLVSLASLASRSNGLISPLSAPRPLRGTRAPKARAEVTARPEPS